MLIVKQWINDRWHKPLMKCYTYIEPLVYTDNSVQSLSKAIGKVLFFIQIIAYKVYLKV